MTTDPRLRPPRWNPDDSRTAWRGRLLALGGVPLLLWYLGWLVHPDRIGHPVLYGVLLAAELFNVAQALGFWWTVAHARTRPPAPPFPGGPVAVDVLIPVYGEPSEVVDPVVAAAVRIRGPEVRVHVLDDGREPRIAEIAARHGARYLTRGRREGAKAGAINDALPRTSAPFVAVFDSDHVPDERFLEATLGHMADTRTALVQTPQYYANHDQSPVADAAFSQQALFFGPIARGKDGLGAMFCCGTGMLLRRAALEDVGGVPERSLTEDFLLSIRLHEQGWRTAYVPQVLARGLGPEDAGAYVGQQLRWARGCLTAIPTALRARLPVRLRLQYVLSSMYFLTGWTLLAYIAFPVVRLVAGAQPVAQATADQFLLHFAPYFGLALLAVSAAGAGAYTFRAYALMVASFWVHVLATVAAVLRLPGRFVVTPKQGTTGPQPGAVWPALVTIGVLVAAVVIGLARGVTPASVNNSAFAVLHVTVLAAGVRPALARALHRPAERPAPSAVPAPEREVVG